jgi:hypothetical protein
MENIVLDPSKWRPDGFVYQGPKDFNNKGFPLLSKGFFNMKADKTNKFYPDANYRHYINSWNYDYNEKNDDLEELAPGKIVFFFSRNQDSPNIFHGGSEFINALSLMYLLNIKPENVQVVFLESMEIRNDPLIELYKNIISRGGTPIHIRELKKKYKISKAIHVPINWDSPCFIRVSVPNCQYPTTTYKLFNDMLNFFMDIKPYEDSFISDNDIFYYPKSVIEHHNQNKPFRKIITFQWRRVWPKGRSGQQRIMGNGPELAEKLSKALPDDYLIRLIDNARLPMTEQISLMKNSDYFLGIHGAGLTLGIFTPAHCIFHEFLPKGNLNWLLLMGTLSGHKIYTDIIDTPHKIIEGSYYYFFNEDEFVNRIMKRMKESGFV